MKQINQEYSARGIIAITSLAIIYGTTAVTARFLGHGTGVYEQWYLRYGLGFLIGLIAFRSRIDVYKFLHLPKKEWSVLIFRAATGWVLATALYTIAAEKAKIGPVAFMQVMPTMAILGIILFHEKLTAKKAFVILAAFIGASMVVISSVHDLTSFSVGEVLSLISGACFALALVTRRWHSNLLNNYELSVGILGLGFVMNYILSLLLYHHYFIGISHFSLGYTAVILIAAVLSVFVVFLGSYGFEHTNAIVASSILDLEQIIAPITGYAFYRETLTLKDYVGGIIILAAAVAMNELSRREQPTNAAGTSNE